MWFTYIIECADGSLYTGSTNNVEARFKEHLAGRGARYTKSHKPVKVVYREAFETKSEALKREAKIKGMAKKEKEKLVAGTGQKTVK